MWRGLFRRGILAAGLCTVVAVAGCTAVPWSRPPSRTPIDDSAAPTPFGDAPDQWPVVAALTAANPGNQAVPAAAEAVSAAKPQAQPGQKASTAPPAPALQLKSPSAVVMAEGSDQVIFAKEPHQRRHPASVTKVMTLIVAMDAIKQGKMKLADTVTISAAAASLGGTQAFLEMGETVTVADLLKAIAVGSANDGAVAIAEHVAGSHEGFVEMMNVKARELGMADSQFRNATGLDADGHFTSAYDVALMSRYLVSQHPEVLRLTSIYLDAMPHVGRNPTELLNRNRLVRFYQGADGLKTGWTESAGYSVSATAKRGGTRIVAVILGAPDANVRQEEVWKLLDFGFAQYASVTLAEPNASFGLVSVYRGREERVTAVPPRLFVVSVPKADRNKVQLRTELFPVVEAPVAKGQVVGKAVAVVEGRPVATLDLVAAAAVERLRFWEALMRSTGRSFSLHRWQ